LGNLFGYLFFEYLIMEVGMSKKYMPLWCKAHFEVNSAKNWGVWFFFERADVVSRGCYKWAKREGLVAFPKAMPGVGHLKRIYKDAFSVACVVQETFSSELLGGLERGCILEHPIFRFALRMTRYIFSWQAQ
jgi:hypothetical protein